MEKFLELYKYIDGVNDAPFPDIEEHLVIREFRYDAKRMGGAPTISFTAMHRLCLDNMWSKDVYATFNGERYYIKQTPTSSYSNSDTRYKHEVELVSERTVLDNVYFYDVVTKDTNVDKPVSNSSKFTFFGDINEYVTRLKYSLIWAKVDYTIVIDEGVSSEEKQVTFENQVFTNALQEIYNIYQIPYYFVGKTIHIGEYQDNIDRVFKYGVNNSLLSISKNNANAKIINRITGVGSQDNIPYYYPNDDEKGVTIPLLNGSTNGISISNQSRYKKVRLFDKFEFHSTIETQIPLINSSIYTLGDLVFDKEEEGKGAQYTVDFYYTFTLDQAEDVSFKVSMNNENTVDLIYEIYKTSGHHLGYFRGENKLSLTGGTYNLIIRWTFLNPEVLFGVEEQIESLISSNLGISASIIVNGEQVWTLKNIPISTLDSYGIRVDNPSDGDIITIQQTSYINPQPFLMPSIYRSTVGKERFYKAENDTYIDENGEYYVFENEYSKKHPSEHIENFDDIKPTIKNVTNAEGFRIDRFVEFAYDLYDNDEVDQDGKFIHKYFFAKLNKLDGENGFNLFDHAIDESEMIISMTSGSCGSCSFKIMVNKDTQKNTVQVDDSGNLLRDSNGNVRFGAPQERQNDTENYEVWIALEKDIDTFGVLMPNATNKYRPLAGDTFVILHIDLPKAYIEAAEKRLDEKLIKYMYDNNFEKFNFSIAFSRIFFAENPSILNSLNENSKITIEYNGREYSLYVSSISIAMTNEQPLPEIKVELNDNITVTKNQISQIVESTKKDILSKTNKDVFWGDIKGIPSWIGSEKPRYSYSELSGTIFQESNTGGYWVLKNDKDNNPYIYTELPVVSKSGYVSYANIDDVELSDIYDGLRIDNQTLYWEEVTEQVGTDEEGKPIYKTVKVLKATGGGGGTGGGSVQYPLSWSGFSEGEWDGSVKAEIEIPSKLSQLKNDGFFQDYGWTGSDANDHHFGSYLYGSVSNSNTPIDSGQLIAYNSEEGEYRGYQMFMHGQNYFYRQHWGNEWKPWRKILSGNVDGEIDYDLHLNNSLYSSGTIYASNNIVIHGQEGGDIEFVFNPNRTLSEELYGGDESIRHSIKFQWYDDSYEIGAVRGGGDKALGFGITYGKNDLIVFFGQDSCDFRNPVTFRENAYVEGQLYVSKTLEAKGIYNIGSTTFKGNGGDEIQTVLNSDGDIGNDNTYEAISIRHALRFNWFKDAYEIGAVRTDWDEAFGFGVTYNNNQLVWKVNRERMDVYGDLRIKNGLIRYNETEGYFYIDGNLLVTGGITAFADSGAGNQWIMDVETLEEVVSDNPFKVYSAKVVSMIASNITNTKEIEDGVTEALDKLDIIKDKLSGITLASTGADVRDALMFIYKSLSEYVRDTE